MIQKFLNKIICGDAVEKLKEIPDCSVDLVVTSPPYNLNKNVRWGGKWANAAIANGYKNHNDCMPHNEYVKWQRECLSEMLRVIKDTGAIFYNHKWRIQNCLFQGRQDIVKDFPVRQIIIWQRTGGFNFNSCYFLPTYEVIYLIAKKKFRLKPKANAYGDVWKIRQELKNPHPAPFPIALSDRIIQSTTGQIILDPFMCSGTTAISAKKNGRDYIGIENCSEYIEMAEQRIQQYFRQTDFWLSN